jgi:hypothetical protein
MKRIMNAYAITTDNAARSTIKEMDDQRERFVHAMTGVKWTDALNYHLSFDAALSGFEFGEQMIMRLVDNVKNTLSL